MKNNLEAIEFAKEYVWNHVINNNEFEIPKLDLANNNTPPSASNIRLDRELQYLLCGYVERTIRQFGEITKRDVAQFVEYWIAAQGTKPKHPEAYQTKL